MRSKLDVNPLNSPHGTKKKQEQQEKELKTKANIHRTSPTAVGPLCEGGNYGVKDLWKK